MTQLLRVFISSPSDVEVERQIALQVIKRIGQKYQNTFELKAVLWEREPLLASGHFQDALDPATADIMVCILWSRLGSPLPERFTTPDGRIGVTGTEWEFEHALTAINENGAPDLMVYRKTSELTANINDPEKTLQIIDQKKQLDDFFDRQFHNQDKDHTFKRAFFPFETSDKFEQQLEIHLTELLEKRLESKQGNNKNQQKAVTWHQGSPFRGLEIFDQEHQAIFFGRTHAIGQVMAQFKEQVSNKHPFLMLLGMSGSGKSSLLNAGLLPLIQTPRVVEYNTGHIRLVKLRPSLCEHQQGPLLGLCHQLIHNFPELVSQGYDAETLEEQILHSPKTLSNTFKQLTATLQKQATLHEDVTAKIQLTIDQFEELFTNKTFTAEQRESFCMGIKTLLDTGYIWCVCTMRSDFNGAAEGTTLIELMRGKGQYTLQPPQSHEIEQIINQPAKAAGLSYEINKQGQSLENELREATVKQVGALPLLEFCLKELFIQRNIETQQLSYSAYERIGKLEGAISQRAEQEIEQLQSQVDIKQALPNVFHALISINPDNEETATSRYMPANQFSIDSDENTIIQILVNARLLVTNEDNNQPTIRIAHEALITHWQRVKDWLIKDIEFLKWHARTERDVNLWKQYNEISSRLLPKGKLLADAEGFLGSRGQDIQRDIKGYIGKSSQREKKYKQIFWTVIVSIFLILSGVTCWAFYERDASLSALLKANHNLGLFWAEKSINSDKELNQERAFVTAVLALSRMKLESNFDIKVAANKIANKALTKIYAKKISSVNEFNSEIEDISFSFNNRKLAIVDGSYLRIFDVASGKQEVLFDTKTELSRVSFSADGESLILGSKDGSVRLWKAIGKALVNLGAKHTGGVSRIFFSTDKKLVIAIGSYIAESYIRVWSVETGALKKDLKIKNHINSIAVSPNGEILAILKGTSIALTSIDSGSVLTELKVKGKYTGIKFSLDGDFLIIKQGSLLKILNISSDNLETIVVIDDVNEYALSPNNILAISKRGDSKIQLWDTVKAKIIAVLEGGEGAAEKLLFSTDGKTLASIDEGKSAFLWNITTKVKRWNEDQLFNIERKIDLRTNILNGHLFDIRTGKEFKKLSGSYVIKHSFSSDGKTLVVLGLEYLYIYNIDNNYIITEKVREKVNGRSSAISLSPDGQFLALSGSGYIRIRDIFSNKEKAVPHEHLGEVTALIFFSNGTKLVSASDELIKIWDVASGELDNSILIDSSTILSVAVSSHGKFIATGGSDATVRIYDVISGRELSVLKGHSGNVKHIKFLPNAVLISKAREEILWDVSSNKAQAVFSNGSSYGLDAMFFGLNGLPYVDEGALISKFGGSVKRKKSINIQDDWSGGSSGLNIQFNGNSGETYWSKYHPFHWLPKAEQGDGNSMIELGNLYLRDDEISKAKHWFNQALALPEFKEVAMERLSITKRIVEYAEANKQHEDKSIH